MSGFGLNVASGVRNVLFVKFADVYAAGLFVSAGRPMEVREDRRQRRRAGRARVGERAAAAGRDVGAEVGLRDAELVDEPVLEDVRLVVVQRLPVLARPRADVARLDGEVAADRRAACRPSRCRRTGTVIRVSKRLMSSVTTSVSG